MKLGPIIVLISMISVAAMFIWSYIEGSWSHAWLAVFIGGIVSTGVSLIYGAKNGKKDKDDKEN